MESGYFLGVSNNVLELDKYKKRKRYKPQTLVCSVMHHHKLDKVDPPMCKQTTEGFEFYDIKDNQLEGTTHLIPIENELLHLHQGESTFSDELALRDVSEDGIFISPINETVLASRIPPHNPI